MKNKFLVIISLAAALITAGCSGNSAANTQQEATATSEVATTEAAATSEVSETRYDSPDGWSVSYNSAEIEEYEDDGTYFKYIGEAEGVNQIKVSYYSGKMPDAVLYEVMADANGLPEHTRSEGYFAGRTDVWSLTTSMASPSAENATDDFVAVERNGGTLLLQITTTKQADEETGTKVSDALAAVVDSFELADQEPQTYSAYVPGKYVMENQEKIDGKKIVAEYYVQLNADHTGVVSMQNEVPIIWYSREGKIFNTDKNEQIYEYNVEGDTLYLSTLEENEEQEHIVFEFTRAATETSEVAATTATETSEVAVTPIDYSDQDSWVYYSIGEGKDVDVFMCCPTVDTLDEENMSLENEVLRKAFVGALNMQRGIYEDNGRLYAPYYRQMAMCGYKLEDKEETERRIQIAYKDISDAFAYYLEHENDGRPIVLAGFSQGADMCYRLLEEYFGKKEIQEKLVAVYAIGWACTDEMIGKYPQIVPAKSADDLGVVITFDCETPEVTSTIVNPAGQKGYCINPLNWKTDATPADKSENLGARFMSSKGEIKREEAGLCGCYIDEERGVLKVPDLNPADYPAKLDILPEGAYHIYDYQFFYRNLQENVRHRIELYMEQTAAADAAA